MPDPKNPPQSKSASDDDQVKSPPADDKKGVPVDTVPAPAKEQEPAQASEQEPQHVQEADVLKEVQEREKEATQEAERKVREDIGEEAKLREPEPEIPPDVADAGVKSPEKEASDVAAKGSTIDLPITEQEYEEGKHEKVMAKVTQKKEVYGVKSIVALAIWIGRAIKKVAHHGKKFVFRKGGDTGK